MRQNIRHWAQQWRRWLFLALFFFFFAVRAAQSQGSAAVKKAQLLESASLSGQRRNSLGTKKKKFPMLQKNEGERGRRRGALELLRERQNESWRRAPPADRRPQLARQVQMSWCRRVCTGGQGGGRVGSQVPARVRLHAAYLLGPSFRCWVWSGTGTLIPCVRCGTLDVLGRCKVEDKSESVSYQRTPWMWCGGAHQAVA